MEVFLHNKISEGTNIMVELIFRHNETERISNLSLRTDHLTLRHPSKQLCVLRKFKFILKREILEKIY